MNERGQGGQEEGGVVRTDALKGLQRADRAFDDQLGVKPAQ